jgi:peptidoglycan/xylan/chitin deacetylase (PgdA/CDA1 family)
MMSLRSSAFHLLRAAGFFYLARYLTRNSLRILCYHGFSIGDEHEFSPLMFMRAETFEGRMRILSKWRIPVITLDEAVRKLPRGEIAAAEAVITLDDGWASNLSIAEPILRRYHYPACIYLSTEHLNANTEVFNVVLAYMIRLSGRSSLHLQGLHPLLDGIYDLLPDPDTATMTLITAADRAFPLAERQQLLEPIARALGVNLDRVLDRGRFRLMSRVEIQQAFGCGLDIQLHTHTHHLSVSDRAAVAGEISSNRAAITAILGTQPRHFCYPSGRYSADHPEWLRQLDIASATTCNPGFNDSGTSVMLLNRFLDSDATSDIAFEAEICGVRELGRQFRTLMRRFTKF